MQKKDQEEKRRENRKEEKEKEDMWPETTHKKSQREI